MQKHLRAKLTINRPTSCMHRAMVWLTLIAYVGQPLIVTAQVVADANAATNKRPVIDTAANGIPLVQITAPNAAGLSHNQFSQYNVDPNGVILNNSSTAVLTQQAGYVSGNQNMANGSARIILNEVTGTSASQLNGYTEVAGSRAEVIIANPNGITCNGCGFINTSRGVLTTGTPVFGGTGSLDAFRVTGGQVTVDAGGLNGSNTNQLDLIARSVKVNGNLWANNLNVVTGANQVNYVNLGVQIITGSGNKPTVGIDVAQLGGMYANKIRLIGTEAGVGVNSLGNIAAQAGDFFLDNQGRITLAGTTSASGNIIINGAAGTTNSGTLYSQQAVQITDLGTITNSGILSAQGNLNLNAANINSTGTLGAGIATNGAATQNGSLTLAASNRIDATGQNIAGSNLNLTGTTVNLANSRTTVGGSATLTATAGDIIHTGGALQSLGSLVLNATGAINNDNGILAGSSLTANAAGLSNVQGMLIGNTGNLSLNTASTLNNTGGTLASALDLTANAITGSGQIIAGRDANLSMQGNYTNAAGGLIKANRNLTISTTGTFTNQSAMEAISNLTLTAGNLDNQTAAIINSANTTLNINAGSITNAGRIEGNTIATASNTFANTGTVIGTNITLRANSLTNLNAAAIIAGTQSVNLIIQNTLTNQDGATIYSLGDVNIGANLALDANGYLIGNATSVTNSSATIEAVGNLCIGANAITNKRTVVGVQWGPEVLGAYVAGNPRYTPSYADQQFTATTTAAGRLLSGMNMRLGGGTVTNDYSTISAGNTLTSNAALTNSGAAFLQRMTVTNGLQDNFVWVQTGWHWGVSCSWKGCWPVTIADYGWVNQPIPYAPAPTYTTIPGSVNVKYLNNTPLAGQPATPTQTAIGSAAIPTVAGTTLTVPSSGLYSIRTQPGQPYLVVTDPRFTSYQNFISSDYMLSRLALDPSLIQKRLGDGFYEQQLVTDQVTQFTGRRFLGQYASAEEQFKALMDSGIATAKEFKLIPGVALTKEQLAALTYDIVWMVEETVSLPGGGTTEVLAPQIYLSRLHAGDLKPGGALIAAEEIDIKSIGTLMNSGTIKSAKATALEAKDILNQGGTISSGGMLNLQAANDIVNFSGKIAGNNVNLTAGRDIINTRTAKDITRAATFAPTSKADLFGVAGITGNSSSTELGLEAGITALDGLNLSAGRDISIVAATVKAVGNASLNAGENITVGTLATHQNDSGAYSAYRNTVTNLTSQIDIGGDLSMKSGNDLKLTAAKINVGNSATLIAGGNIDLKAAKDSAASGFDSGVGQGKHYDETVLGTTLNAGNITLAASNGQGGRTDGNGNITLEGAAINSNTGNTTLIADGNVNVGSVAEKHESSLSTTTESHGLLASTTTTAISETAQTFAKGSSINGNNISIQAGNQTSKTGDITIQGSQLAATNTVSLNAGHDLNILSAENTARSGSSEFKTRTGLSVGSNGLEYGKNNSTTLTDGSTTQAASSLTGKNIVTQSGNDTRIRASNIQSTENTTLYSGNNLYIESAANTVTHNQETTETKIGLNLAMMDGRFHDLSVGRNSKITENGYTSTTQMGSQIGSLGNLNLLSGNNILLSASTLNAGRNIGLTAAGDILITGQYNQHTTDQSTANRMSSMKSKNKTDDQTQDYTYVGSTLDAGNTLNLKAGNNLDLVAAQLNSGADTNLTAAGQVRFLTQKNIRVDSQTFDNEDLIYEVHTGKGSKNETLVYNRINAGGPSTGSGQAKLNVHAAKGIVVEVEEKKPTPPADTDGSTNHEPSPPPTFTDTTAALAKQPGMAWMNDMLKRDDIDWQKVSAAHDHWDYKNQNLTEAGAAILVIVVTYFTAGAASSAAGSVTGATATTAAGGTVAATTAMTTAAITAGLTTLATQAAVSLANNGGDLGKTLDDMGKSENVHALLTAMVTAGVLQGLNTQLGMQKINAQSGFGSQLQKNLIDNTASATLNHALNGGDFQQQLEQSLKSAFIDTGAAQSAYKIGDLNTNHDLNAFTHQLAHAIAGCAAGAAKSNDCGSGALGAAVGEMAAEWYGGNRSNANNLDIPALQTDTVNFARMISGIAAAVTGNDVNAAAGAGGDAAENNYLNHQENSDRLKAVKGCADGNDEACKQRDALDATDKKRDAEFNQACQDNPNSEACSGATKDMRSNLATYFPTKNGVQPKNDELTTSEKDAGLGSYTSKKELQSYVDLLKVSNQQIKEDQADVKPAKLPNAYNSDPYGVMDAKKPDLYMVVKVGDQWGVVGNSDKVNTSVAGVNGMSNETNYAPGLMGAHVQKEFDTASLYTLYYNPTEGFLSDGWETFRDKLGFTTPITKQFSQVLSDVQNGGKPVSWIAHSQGGVIFSEAVRYNGGDLSQNSVVFHSGANNELMTNYYLQNAGINSLQEKPTTYLNSPWDFVPNVIGLNGNIFEILGSTVASPLLFMGPTVSPHTLPYNTAPQSALSLEVTP
jgi:filamentous hemagglutinin family protein